jgi:hypothetical protein
MTVLKLYVEGGGESKELRTNCREAFARFLQKSGMTGRMPRIVACGSRRNAFDSYRTAIANGEMAVLLIDSETPVLSEDQQGSPDSWQPWHHLRRREGTGWVKPEAAVDQDCHFMVQCMESWIIADRAVLDKYFGSTFNPGALPGEDRLIEKIEKREIFEALRQATSQCRKQGRYDKTRHAFKLLAEVEPHRVIKFSPWAGRFIQELSSRMNSLLR